MKKLKVCQQTSRSESSLEESEDDENDNADSNTNVENSSGETDNKKESEKSGSCSQTNESLYKNETNLTDQSRTVISKDQFEVEKVQVVEIDNVEHNELKIDNNMINCEGGCNQEDNKNF